MQRPVYRRELTPMDFLIRSASLFPHKIAVVHGSRHYTYAQFAERAYLLASALIKKGLQPQDRVAFLSPNIPPLLEAHYGVPLAGGILIAINVRLKAQEINTILDHSGARFLFLDAELERSLGPLNLANREVVHIEDTGLPGDPYEDLLATGSPEQIGKTPDDEEDVIALNYTSGTTGLPKGVMYTHRAAYLQALGDVIEMGLRFESAFLWTLPMFHCNGWCFTWAVTAVGGCHICLRKVEADAIWNILDKEEVTHLCAAPTVHTAIVNHPNAHPLDRIIQAGIGGSTPSTPLLSHMVALHIQPIHLYGLTESYGPNMISRLQEEERELALEQRMQLLARQGQAYLPAELVRVVNEDMQDVPRDGATMGEVVMGGNTIMKGYFRQPEMTEAAFRDGRFHTGDLGIWYPDGSIELRDRKKDIIISGGENISTIEVEQVIAQHPAVLECAVVAIPDKQWGERPKAFVTLRPNQQASAEEIIQFCRERLAHFKCPVAISFGELPKTGTGKIQKFLLREQEWAGHEKRIN